MEGSKEIILYILLFFVISMPFTYNVTNKLLNTLDKKGCPTYLGIFLHTIIFGVLIYVINKLEFIKEDFQVLKQVAPKICDIKKGNQDCPNNYLCVENYDFCQGTKKNTPSLCKSYEARCFKKCNDTLKTFDIGGGISSGIRSGDHDCGKADNCWATKKGNVCSYQDYFFNT